MDIFAKNLVNEISQADADFLTGIAVGILVVYILLLVFALVVLILWIIGRWKILKKAGQPGWAALIPYYGDYCLCKATGINVWWVLVLVIVGFISSLFSNSDNSVSIISLLVFAVNIYYSVIISISLARSFGKSDGYGIGLIFLQPFFVFALGAGSSQYLGPKPMNDPVMGLFDKKDNNNVNNNNSNNNNFNNNNNSENTVNDTVNNDNNQSESKKEFCSGCGAELDPNAKFCTSCGKER